MNIDLIKELRDETGASIALCRECLEETGGDLSRAKEILRKKGVEIATKKSSRATGEGTIGVYLHTNAKIAAAVTLRCETDFVARNEEFRQLAKDLAMHVVAMQPLYRAREDVPAEVKEKETCLMEQPFVKDDTRSVKEVIREKIQKLGENIEVGEFVRLAV